MTEEWRSVPGYEGQYSVSSWGRVYSHKSSCILKAPIPFKTVNGKRVSVGYRQVNLWCDGRGWSPKVHVLVALAFHGPRPDAQEVRHLDGDSLNNCADNLAYGTRSANVRDRVAHGTDPNASKARCPQGHPYEGGNLYVTPSGSRRCRACNTDAAARYKARKAEQWQR